MNRTPRHRNSPRQSNSEGNRKIFSVIALAIVAGIICVGGFMTFDAYRGKGLLGAYSENAPTASKK